jgi:hypothetical protein
MPVFGVAGAAEQQMPEVYAQTLLQMPQFAATFATQIENGPEVLSTMPQFSAEVNIVVTEPKEPPIRFWMAARGLGGYRRGLNSL